MRKITVHLENRSYPILIGKGLLRSLGTLLKSLRLGSKILIVSNKKVAEYFLNVANRSLRAAGFRTERFLLPYGNERDKSEHVLVRLWNNMARIGLDRTSTVLALGGGVVGDAAGFAASTYMRGISLVQVPTTLVGQVDSAIGGKTAIDLPAGKNLVGTFYEPRLVVSDVEALATLGEWQFHSQFAEVIKYGMIQDSELFELLERNADWFFSSKGKFLSKRHLQFLEIVVWRSALAKAKVVELDEKETKGLRMILNYGHTFAHALEAASKFDMPHGSAVARGMILAGELAVRMGIFSRVAQDRQRDLIERLSCPASYCFSSSKILSFMKRDKKTRDGKLRFVLPQKIGRVNVYENVPEKRVREVLDELRSA